MPSFASCGKSSQYLTKSITCWKIGSENMKCWNVRDQTDTTLAKTLARTYKEIEATYKQIRQAATIEDAKFYVDMAFRKKALANDI